MQFLRVRILSNNINASIFIDCRCVPLEAKIADHVIIVIVRYNMTVDFLCVYRRFHSLYELVRHWITLLLCRRCLFNLQRLEWKIDRAYDEIVSFNLPIDSFIHCMYWRRKFGWRCFWLSIAVIASEAIATNGTENRESMTWSDWTANPMLENERQQLSAVARAHSENSFVHNKKYEKSLN